MKYKNDLTKITINNKDDISNLVEYWYIYIQPKGIGVVFRGQDLLSYYSKFLNIKSVTIEKESKTVKIMPKEYNPIVTTKDSENVIEIWIQEGVIK